jgi:hypothetical protein
MRLGARRIGLGLADQALASASSFLLAVVVARGASASEFGAFALAWTAYWLCLGMTRALICEPLLIRYGGLGPTRSRIVTARAAGAALWLGIGLAIPCALVGALVPGTSGSWLLVLAPVLPALLVQDVWRAAAFARSDPRRAFTNDLVWFSLFACGAVLVEANVLTGAHAPMVAWGAAGCIAAVAGAWQARAVPALSSPIRWWRRVRPLGGRLVAEFTTLSLAGQLSTYAVAIAGGLAATGALRGAQSLLGVMNVLFAGLLFTLVPHGVGLARSSPREVLALSRRIACACALAALVFGIGLSQLPEQLGAALLGAVWPESRGVLVPLAVAFAFAGIVFGATAGLRSLADARRSLRARLIVAPVTVAGAAVGAAFGARGAAAGLAAAGLVAAVVWWRTLAAAVSASERTDESPIPPQPARGYLPLAGRRPHVAATD